MSQDLMDLAERTLAQAQQKGAQDAAVSASRGRSISVQYRDGELEQVRESASAQLGVSLYVDGRYSTHSTNDLRPEAVDAFLDRAVALTRLLAEDPNRGLADPALYAGRSEADLGIRDPAWESLDTEARKRLAEEAMAGARAVEGPILSVTAGMSDGIGESVRLHSNGFSGRREGTRFGLGVEVSVKDEGDRRPEEWDAASTRRQDALPNPATVGRRAAERAMARLGQRKLPSGTFPLVVDPRAGSTLLRHFLAGLGGAVLHQRRSFLLDRLGDTVGTEAFHLVDDPLLVGGLASQHYDGDGIAARPRTLVDHGKLAGYLVDVYYGRKLGVTPEGGGTTNLTVAPGAKSQAEIIADMSRGILVTGFLGGNADVATGDFSHGIVGFVIADGKLAGPIGEMNVTGSHRALWNQLRETGNNPYPWSSWRLPTMVFTDVDVSGA